MMDGNGNENDNGNNVVIGDSLNLAMEMMIQDTMGAKVFLDSIDLIQTLGRLLDLRSGVQFRNPPPKHIVDTVSNDDDLDDILNSNGTGTDVGKVNGISSNAGADAKKKTTSAQVPYLTEEESSVTILVLELLMVLIVGMKRKEIWMVTVMMMPGGQRSDRGSVDVTATLYWDVAKNYRNSSERNRNKGHHMHSTTTDLNSTQQETKILQMDMRAIREEMTGLSAAYTRLEVEYNTLLELDCTFNSLYL